MANYTPYFAMMKAGLPEHEIRMRIESDGYDPDAFFDGLASRPPPPPVPRGGGPKFAPPPLPPRGGRGGGPKFGPGSPGFDSSGWNYDDSPGQDMDFSPPPIPARNVDTGNNGGGGWPAFDMDLEPFNEQVRAPPPVRHVKKAPKPKQRKGSRAAPNNAGQRKGSHAMPTSFVPKPKEKPAYTKKPSFGQFRKPSGKPVVGATGIRPGQVKGTRGAFTGEQQQNRIDNHVPRKRQPAQSHMNNRNHGNRGNNHNHHNHGGRHNQGHHQGHRQGRKQSHNDGFLRQKEEENERLKQQMAANKAKFDRKPSQPNMSHNNRNAGNGGQRLQRKVSKFGGGFGGQSKGGAFGKKNVNERKGSKVTKNGKRLSGLDGNDFSGKQKQIREAMLAQAGGGSSSSSKPMGSSNSNALQKKSSYAGKKWQIGEGGESTSGVSRAGGNVGGNVGAKKKLPDGWQEGWSDEYQHPYYINTATGESHWEIPASAYAASKPKVPTFGAGPPAFGGAGSNLGGPKPSFGGGGASSFGGGGGSSFGGGGGGGAQSFGGGAPSFGGGSGGGGKLDKYDMMRKAGLPEGAVQQAMQRDGVGGGLQGAIDKDHRV